MAKELLIDFRQDKMSLQGGISAMTITTRFPSIDSVEQAQRILDQDHERLHPIGWRIQQSASDGKALAAALAELNSALIEHFAHEESPKGLLAILGANASAERQAFAEILAEHESILANVQELLAQARAGTTSPAGLSARATMLTRFLGDHEHREGQVTAAILARRPAPQGPGPGPLSADSPRR
jgi:hemerythrin